MSIDGVSSSCNLISIMQHIAFFFILIVDLSQNNNFVENSQCFINYFELNNKITKIDVHLF